MSEQNCVRLVVASELLRVLVTLFMLAVVVALHRDVTAQILSLRESLSSFERRVTR